MKDDFTLPHFTWSLLVAINVNSVNCIWSACDVFPLHGYKLTNLEFSCEPMEVKEISEHYTIALIGNNP